MEAREGGQEVADVYPKSTSLIGFVNWDVKNEPPAMHKWLLGDISHFLRVVGCKTAQIILVFFLF